MKLKSYIQKVLSSINSASEKLCTNKVDFDVNLVIKGQELYVSTEKSENSLRIKFSVNPKDEKFDLGKLFEDAKKNEK